MLGSATFTEFYQREVRPSLRSEIDIWFTPLPGNSELLQAPVFNETPSRKHNEDYYQDYFCKQLSQVMKVFKKNASTWELVQEENNLPITNVSVYSTQDHIYLDGRKPDISIIPSNAPLTQMHVLALGKIKLPRTTDFSSDAKGEVLTFALRVLKVQPNRSEVTCFLTDIKFFRAKRVRTCEHDRITKGKWYS